VSPGDECNYCRAPIRWMTTVNGKAMPVDAQPSERGNVIRLGEHAGVLGPRQADAARYAGNQLFMPHVATCPDADKWRGKKPARAGAGRRRRR
jgi:hypothetical protein